MAAAIGEIVTSCGPTERGDRSPPDPEMGRAVADRREQSRCRFQVRRPPPVRTGRRPATGAIPAGAIRRAAFSRRASLDQPRRSDVRRLGGTGPPSLVHRAHKKPAEARACEPRPARNDRGTKCDGQRDECPAAYPTNRRRATVGPQPQDEDTARQTVVVSQRHGHARRGGCGRRHPQAIAPLAAVDHQVGDKVKCAST